MTEVADDISVGKREWSLTGSRKRVIYKKKIVH